MEYRPGINYKVLFVIAVYGLWGGRCDLTSWNGSPSPQERKELRIDYRFRYADFNGLSPRP